MDQGSESPKFPSSFGQNVGCFEQNIARKAAKYTETRIARNGKAYTAAEFRDYYIDYLGEEGWVKEWSTSKEETRKANDGTFYTFDDFVA